jgi:membrane protein YdbS with pleckstrin-like domain
MHACKKSGSIFPQRLIFELELPHIMIIMLVLQSAAQEVLTYGTFAACWLAHSSVLLVLLPNFVAVLMLHEADRYEHPRREVSPRHLSR